MSRTISPGMHNVGRWSLVALVLKMHLKGRERAPAGAFPAINKFFSWIIDGIDQDEGKFNPGSPPMAGICALGDARSLFDGLGWDSDLPAIRTRIEAFKELTCRSETEPVETLLKEPLFEELRLFVVELYYQAEIERGRHALASRLNDDDD